MPVYRIVVRGLTLGGLTNYKHACPHPTYSIVQLFDLRISNKFHHHPLHLVRTIFGQELVLRPSEFRGRPLHHGDNGKTNRESVEQDL